MRSSKRERKNDKKDLFGFTSVAFSLLFVCACSNKHEFSKSSPKASSDLPPEADLTTSGNSDNVLEESNWRSDGVLKILAIGNSFSDDSMQYVYPIAKSIGVEKIVLGTMMIGGSTLNDHVYNIEDTMAAYDYRRNVNGTWQTTSNSRLCDALREENWDYVILQNQSILAGQPKSFKKLDLFLSYIREYISETRLPVTGYYLSMDFGRYIAGMMFVHALTGLPVDDVAYAPDMVDQTVQKIVAEAVNALKIYILKS